MIFRSLRRALTLLLPLVLLAACATSPTGRPQLRLFSSEQLNQMGDASYQQMREQATVMDATPEARFVECVASEITPLAPGDWQLTVFEGEEVNAFALPGGNIGVYAGMLDVAENQDQLAAVIGHEIAHVLADHANARMSTQFATQAGLELASAVAGGTPRGQQAMAALGLGAQVGVLLPFSRGQETEADVMGLELMARAGFDPRAAVQLWMNMAAQAESRPPAILSTHPVAEQRIERLRADMDPAMALYREARAAGRRPDCRHP